MGSSDLEVELLAIDFDSTVRLEPLKLALSLNVAAEEHSPSLEALPTMMELMVVERRWVGVDFVEAGRKVLALVDQAAVEDIRLDICSHFEVVLNP